jgi:DNA-directed RNA polymerase subunit RPC12/RpoP
MLQRVEQSTPEAVLPTCSKCGAAADYVCFMCGKTYCDEHAGERRNDADGTTFCPRCVSRFYRSIIAYLVIVVCVVLTGFVVLASYILTRLEYEQVLKMLSSL